MHDTLTDNGKKLRPTMKLAVQLTVTATDEAAGRADWLNSSVRHKNIKLRPSLKNACLLCSWYWKSSLILNLNIQRSKVYGNSLVEFRTAKAVLETRNFQSVLLNIT